MEQRRKLGSLEIKCNVYICNVAVPTLLSLKCNIDEHLLKEATLQFIKSQPNINAGVKLIDGEWRFVPLMEINDYFEVLPLNYQWKDICVKYSNCRLREESDIYPPLKVFFIPQSNTVAYFIPVYTHYAGDGTNGMTIAHDILQKYNQLRKGESFEKITYNPPPSVEDMAESALPLNQKKELIDKYLSYIREGYKKFNCGIPFEEGEKPAIQALYYTSTILAYDKFIQACRMNKVTVGSALIAAMYFGNAGYVFHNDTACQEELFIGINIPINLRNRVPKNVPNKCCNLSVTQLLLTMGVTKEIKFWDLAKKVRKDLVEFMSDDNLFHLFDFALNNTVKSSTEREYQAAFEKFGVSHQSCVSNMKSYPSSVDYDDFNIESIHCVGGWWIIKWDVLELMIYSTNKFNLSIIHREGTKNAIRADIVFKYVKYIVENMSQLSPDFNLLHCMENYDSVESALE